MTTTDSASKEAYSHVGTTYPRAWISGSDSSEVTSKLQCNHVHGMRVDDMRVQCRYSKLRI